MSLPDPAEPYPIRMPDGTPIPSTVFLKPLISHPRFEVGAYTYASDFDPPEPTGWAGRLAPFLFEFSKERLRIGKFCQIANAVRFITASASHDMRGPSTFPFPIFDAEARAGYQPDTRDTLIGHDVWFGYGALILPGARIGNGAIIGAGSVVRGEIPDYAVVTGNPASVLRMRYSEPEIERLNALCWWDWSPDEIARAIPTLLTGSPRDLSR